MKLSVWRPQPGSYVNLTGRRCCGCRSCVFCNFAFQIAVGWLCRGWRRDLATETSYRDLVQRWAVAWPYAWHTFHKGKFSSVPRGLEAIAPLEERALFHVFTHLTFNRIVTRPCCDQYWYRDLAKRSLIEILPRELLYRASVDISSRLKRSCQETSFREFVQRSCQESSYGDLLQRHCIEIYWDFAKRAVIRACAEISEADLAKGPCLVSLYRELAKRPLRDLAQRHCIEICWDLAKRSLTEILPRELF